MSVVCVLHRGAPGWESSLLDGLSSLAVLPRPRSVPPHAGGHRTLVGVLMKCYVMLC